MRVAYAAHIPDILSNHSGGLHVNELSTIVKIEKEKLARVLRMLATRNCFREGTFSNTQLVLNLHSAYLMELSTVDIDVFANNRLSMILHTDNPVSDFADICTDEAPKAALVLYENLVDPTTAGSYEPSLSPFMYAVKDSFTGSFFEFQKLYVRMPLHLRKTCMLNTYPQPERRKVGSS